MSYEPSPSFLSFSVRTILFVGSHHATRGSTSGARLIGNFCLPVIREKPDEALLTAGLMMTEITPRYANYR